METAQRRRNLKESLIDAAEHGISSHGLPGLRARTLAERIGCAVGAIYNVVADLDELIMLVNSRTLAALERELLAAEGAHADPQGDDAAIDRLCRMALAYLDFATTRRLRWRAVFEHRLPAGDLGIAPEGVEFACDSASAAVHRLREARSWSTSLRGSS